MRNIEIFIGSKIEIFRFSPPRIIGHCLYLYFLKRFACIVHKLEEAFLIVATTMITNYTNACLCGTYDNMKASAPYFVKCPD